MHADKLGRQRGQLIDVLRPLPFDDDVGAFDVAEVTQARPQPLTCGTLEGKTKKPDAWRFRLLLRAGHERPRGRRAAEQRDKLATSHVPFAAYSHCFTEPVGCGGLRLRLTRPTALRCTPTASRSAARPFW